MPFQRTDLPKKFRHYLEEEVYNLIRRGDGSFFDWLQISNTDGMWYWDMENPEHEWYSDQFLTFLGFTPGEVSYTSDFWQQQIHPEDKERTLERARKHLEDQDQPYDQEVRYFHKDGHILWVRCRGVALRNDAGEPLRFLGTHQDITKLKQTQIDLEKALQNTHNRLDALRSASPDLTGIISRDGYYTDIASGQDVAAIKNPKDIVGQKVIDIGDPVQARKAWTKAQQAMDTGEVITWVFESKHNPGAIYEARFASTSPDECLVLVRDVTHSEEKRVALEEQVRLRTQELEASNEELRQFAYSASHDLREPLLKVKSFGQRIQEKYGDILPDKGNNYLKVMLDATERMQRLMDDLLSYSRVGRKEDPFKEVDLNEVLRLVLEDLSPLIESSKASIKSDVLPTVYADGIQVGMLFQNLISNGIKFRAEGRDPQIHIGVEEEEGFWVISVADNGIGFDPKYHSKIFQIFERLHTRFEYPGTGIGLALCLKIMDRHKGWIKADSTPGEGSTFKMGFRQDAL